FVMACVASALAWRTLSLSDWIDPSMAHAGSRGAPLGDAAELGTAEPAPAETAKPTAGSGWRVRHEGHVPLPGGVLFLPASFDPGAEGYDLVIHFHGNTQIVRESFEHAGINAAVAVINHGIRSAAYRT